MKTQSFLIQSLAALAFFSEGTVASGSSLRSSSAAADPSVIDPPCSNHCKKLRLGPDKMTACLEKYCGSKSWINEGGVADYGASTEETTMVEKDSAASSMEVKAEDTEDDDVAECERHCRMKRWAPRLVEECVRGCHHGDQREHDNEGENAADEGEQDAEDDTSDSEADADAGEDANEKNQKRKADQFANGNDAQDEENSDSASVAECERRCRMRRWGPTKVEQCLRECQENFAAKRTTDEFANDNEDEEEEEEGDSSDGTSEQDKDGEEPDGDYFMECVRNCTRKRWVRRLMDQCIEDCHSQNHLDGGEGFDVGSDESTAGTTATKKLI